MCVQKPPHCYKSIMSWCGGSKPGWLISFMRFSRVVKKQPQLGLGEDLWLDDSE